MLFSLQYGYCLYYLLYVYIQPKATICVYRNAKAATRGVHDCSFRCCLLSSLSLSLCVCRKLRMVRCLDDDLSVLSQELPIDGFLDALGGPRESLLVEPDLAVP